MADMSEDFAADVATPIEDVALNASDAEERVATPDATAAVEETGAAKAPTEESGEDPYQKKMDDRMARFKALKARSAQAKIENRKAVQEEAQRKAVDPSQLTALHRKHAIASHKLAKADAEASGESFERKRAWDWTVDEAEKWDERLASKKRARDDVAFQDYTQQARKVYDREMARLGDPDLAKYKADKEEKIRKGVERGQLVLVEREDGEVVAVDKTGSFRAEEALQIHNKRPSEDKIDALVANLNQAEESRQKKKRERRDQNDDGDVTYINEKNKVFNQKLARFYDKYTGDIRENFERGTAI